jgi:hypothetical protein
LRPPGERSAVAEFQQDTGSDVAAQEHTGVRHDLMVVAEVKHQPRGLTCQDDDLHQRSRTVPLDSGRDREQTCVSVPF